LKAQAEKLERIESRLERMAAVAEAGGSANAVSQLAGQQIRAVEVGAKLAGVGGYAPSRPAGDGAPAAPVVISFNFAGVGRMDTMTINDAAGAPVLDECDHAEADDAAEPIMAATAEQTQRSGERRVVWPRVARALGAR